MIQFQEKAWKNRWKDGQTLFHRTLPANAGGPKSGNFELIIGIFLNSAERFMELLSMFNIYSGNGSSFFIVEYVYLGGQY